MLTWLAGLACLVTLWTRFGAPADDNFTGSDPGQISRDGHIALPCPDLLKTFWCGCDERAILGSA